MNRGSLYRGIGLYKGKGLFVAKGLLTPSDDPELVTSLVNGTTYPYETANISGRDITSAINSSGFGSIYDNVMMVDVAIGDKFRLKMDFVLNSGEKPNVLIMANGDAVSGTATTKINPTTGSYDVILTGVANVSGAELTFYNLANSDWEATNISLKRE